MKKKIYKLGNSKGIIIPNIFLKDYNKNEIELIVSTNYILIKKIKGDQENEQN